MCEWMCSMYCLTLKWLPFCVPISEWKTTWNRASAMVGILIFDVIVHCIIVRNAKITFGFIFVHLQFYAGYVCGSCVQDARTYKFNTSEFQLFWIFSNEVWEQALPNVQLVKSSIWERERILLEYYLYLFSSTSISCARYLCSKLNFVV